MSKKNLAPTYRRLGATRKNERWSWGGYTEGGQLILNVWSDLFVGNLVQVFGKAWGTEEDGSPGRNERAKHIAGIKDDEIVKLIVCHAEDVNANPRSIKSHNDKSVFLGQGLVETNDKIYLKVIGREEI